MIRTTLIIRSKLGVRRFSGVVHLVVIRHFAPRALCQALSYFLSDNVKQHLLSIDERSEGSKVIMSD